MIERIVKVTAGPNRNQRLKLGKQGENLARCIVFDCAALAEIYGEGTADVLHQRPRDEAPYPCTVTQEGNMVRWPITSADVAQPGTGKTELRWHVGDTLAKSVLYSTYIIGALGCGSEPPEPAQGWVDQVLEVGRDVTEVSAKLEDMTATVTEVSAKLEDMTATVTKDGNAAVITIKDKDGTTTATVYDGEKGDIGPQGPQGPKGDTGDTGPQGPSGRDAEVDATLTQPGKAADAAATGAAVRKAVDDCFAAMLDDTNTTDVFKKWWPLSDDGYSSKNERLSRWFEMLRNDKTYGVVFHAPEVSGDTFGDYTDDSVGLTCELSTDTVQGADTLDEQRAFWWLRVNATEVDDRGTLDILYHEYEDGFDITGEIAPVLTLQVAPYIRKAKTETQLIRQLRTLPAAGFHSWAEGRDPDGTQRPYVAHYAYGGGLDANGYVTSGSGKRPMIRTSYNTAIAKIKQGRPYQTIYQSHDQNWLLLMWQLRHASLAPSGQMEGCTNYNLQYFAARGETDVKRVMLTAAQAGNLHIGCAVSVGETGGQTNADRNVAYNYNLADCVLVAKKETVNIDGTEYVAVYLDIPSPITTTTTTRISTMPWWSGQTDNIMGRNDGSPRSNADSHNPCRCAGIEFLTGCYRIAGGELYKYATAADGTSSDLQLYACTVQGSEAASLTADYADTGLRLTSAAANWLYIKSMDDTYDNICFPAGVGGAGANSSAYLRDAFYHPGRKSGLSVPWLFGCLDHGGPAGLVCASGHRGAGPAGWNGAPGLSRRCWRGELRA